MTRAAQRLRTGSADTTRAVPAQVAAGGSPRSSTTRAGPSASVRTVQAPSPHAINVAFGLLAGTATAFVGAAPPVLIQAVAGLALLGAFAGALQAALAVPEMREAAVITFLVTASGLTVLGISGAFWGLLAGGAILALHRRRG